MAETSEEVYGSVESRAAFTRAATPHLLVVAQVARRFAPAGEAEDVQQEALLAAWRYRSTFDPRRGEFRAWLLAIVIRECRRAAARGSVRERFLRTMGLWRAPELAIVSTPATGALADIEVAMESLSKRQREVVDLYYFGDLPVKTIAQALRLSAGTVKSTLADARYALRDLLIDSGYELADGADGGH